MHKHHFIYFFMPVDWFHAGNRSAGIKNMTITGYRLYSRNVTVGKYLPDWFFCAGLKPFGPYYLLLAFVCSISLRCCCGLSSTSQRSVISWVGSPWARFSRLKRFFFHYHVHSLIRQHRYSCEPQNYSLHLLISCLTPSLSTRIMRCF